MNLHILEVFCLLTPFAFVWCRSVCKAELVIYMLALNGLSLFICNLPKIRIWQCTERSDAEWVRAQSQIWYTNGVLRMYQAEPQSRKMTYNKRGYRCLHDIFQHFNSAIKPTGHQNDIKWNQEPQTLTYLGL